MELGKNVKYLRKKVLKMTIAEFAKYLGVTPSAINNIEGNVLARPELKEPLYRLICSEFNVNYEWLKTGQGEMLKDKEKNTKADALKTLSDYYGWAETDTMYFEAILDLSPENLKGLIEIGTKLSTIAKQGQEQDKGE